MMPRLINQGIDAQQAEAEGWQRQVVLRAREQLRTKHAYGRHISVTAGCPACSFEIGLLLRALYEPPRDVRRFFE